MGIGTPSNEPSDEPLEAEVSPEMKEALEDFAEDLDGAAELAADMGFSTPLQGDPGLPSLDVLETLMSKEAILEILMKKFGVDPTADPVKQYPMGGPDDAEDEGTPKVVEVKVFATNVPDVYLGQYIDANGGSDWTIRPLELEDFPE